MGVCRCIICVYYDFYHLFIDTCLPKVLSSRYFKVIAKKMVYSLITAMALSTNLTHCIAPLTLFLLKFLHTMMMSKYAIL